jgi:Peptidase inhibitor family I36
LLVNLSPVCYIFYRSGAGERISGAFQEEEMPHLSVWNDDNYTGQRFDFDDSCSLVPGDLNDHMTSYKVERGWGVRFFDDENYQKPLFYAPSGDYGLECPGVKKEHNDKMSSFILYYPVRSANRHGLPLAISAAFFVVGWLFERRNRVRLEDKDVNTQSRSIAE